VIKGRYTGPRRRARGLEPILESPVRKWEFYADTKLPCGCWLRILRRDLFVRVIVPVAIHEAEPLRSMPGLRPRTATLTTQCADLLASGGP
jgi:hypothetical protein